MSSKWWFVLSVVFLILTVVFYPRQSPRPVSAPVVQQSPQAGASPPAITTTAGHFVLLGNIPDWTANWLNFHDKEPISFGDPDLLERGPGGILRVYNFQLFTKQTFRGNMDVVVKLKHKGLGGTNLYLRTPNGLKYVEVTINNNNFRAGVHFSSSYSHTGAIEPGYEADLSPYLNKWITIRFLVVGEQAKVFIDGRLKRSLAILPDDYYVGIDSINFGTKSDHETDIRSVELTGTTTSQ